jgi:hypothetical protein
MADRTDDLREALYFALSGNYEIEAADYRRAAGLLAQLGYVPLTDVLDALRDDDAYHRWRKALTGVRPEYPPLTTRHHLADYLAERFAPTTAPEGADERNGHG